MPVAAIIALLAQLEPPLQKLIVGAIDTWSAQNPGNPGASEWITLRTALRTYDQAIKPDAVNG